MYCIITIFGTIHPVKRTFLLVNYPLANYKLFCLGLQCCNGYGMFECVMNSFLYGYGEILGVV